MMQFKAGILLLAVFGCSVLATTATPILNLFADQFNLEASVQTLFPVVDKLDQKLERVAQCFEPELAGQSVNIFDHETSIKSIVNQYYQAFPKKTITKESISQLLSSIGEITSACLQTDVSTIRYGLTQLSDLSDAEIEALSSLEVSSTYSTNGMVGLNGLDAACRKTGASIPASFDWRTQHVVTEVRDQGSTCGSCWAIATAESIESAYLIQNKTKNSNFLLSVQQIVDCAEENGCTAGNSIISFPYVKKHGLTSEDRYSYRESDNSCKLIRINPIVATIKDYCIRSKVKYTEDFHTESIADHDILEALVNYGPLYISLDANTGWTRNYRGGVVNGPCTTKPNHAVLLVGYNEKAWIIKNSWGGSWGEAGYFELARGTNLCGINTEIAYPLL